MGGISSLSSYETAVRSAESALKAQQANREEAKKVGNYQKACKNYNVGGKAMNVYDANVYNAKEQLKVAKARLSEAKKRYK